MQSECFYTAGKSDDLGEVVNYLHRKQPETPLYALGTSLGANILVHLFSGNCHYTCVDVSSFCFAVFVGKNDLLLVTKL